MKSPFLLCQTPRAGSKNHRYLASLGSGVGELDASNLITEALRLATANGQRAEGCNFMAVIKRGVLQASGGRTGDEVLLWGGIEVNHLDISCKQNVFQQLEQLMPELKELIERIDWEREEGILVERGELGDWLQRGLSDVVTAPQRPRFRFWMTFLAVVALVAVVASVLNSFWWARGNQQNQTAPQPSSGKSSIQEVRNPDQQLLDDFLQKYEIPRDKRDLAIAELPSFVYTDEARRKTVDVLKDKEMRQFLKEATRDPAKHLSPYFFVEKDLDRNRSLQVLIGDLDRWKSVDISPARQCLAKCGICLSRFRTNIGNREIPDLDRDLYPLLNSARELAMDRELELHTSERSSSRVLPFFDKHDVAIAAALDRMKALDFFRDIQTKADTNVKSLSGILVQFESRRKAITEQLKEEYQLFRKKGGLAHEEPIVRHLRIELENLLYDLGELDFSLVHSLGRRP
jgi:hypothetical protein